MTNSLYEGAAMVAAALKFVPPLIRESLLDDEKFLERYGFKTESMISFGTSSVSIQRSKFFDAVRTVLAGEATVELTDTEDRTWNLACDATDNGLPRLALVHDK